MGPAAAYARDTRAALEREAVDALASDYLLFGPPIAAERAGVPTALLVHQNIYIVPEPGKPAPGPGFPPRAESSSAGRGTAPSAARCGPVQPRAASPSTARARITA